jgi:predicted ATPase/signal transduction histidine kinase/GAF domain-containing protein
LLRQDRELTLWRRPSADATETVLVLMPSAERPAPSLVARLEHELALRAEIDDEWAVRARTLSDEHGLPVLVLDDPGGELLSARIGQGSDIATFLRTALGISAALASLHARQLIHGDIKPGNLLVDTDTFAVRLLGFGFASSAARPHGSVNPGATLEGTLEYMAPEQTGRMNRPVDARSDLYALGTTLYQLLTGRLPFSAASASEWVHCQIAKAPPPPAKHRADVPEILAAIVMRLLAKAPEDRYQTAAGVRTDLARCLEQWESKGDIAPFDLGASDVPEQLLLPERVYGRSREVAELLAAYGRIAAEGRPELVLVSGYAGIGKSAIVHELERALAARSSWFCSGKFEQYKSDVPYAPLAQAFAVLVRRLLTRSEAELELYKHALVNALGANARLLCDLVPELRLILGATEPVVALPPDNARHRLQLVVRSFVGVFARAEHPLALFLDDLQWLDGGTLDLIEHLVTHGDLRYLLVVGAYRDNEIDESHALVAARARIGASGARLREISLGSLGSSDLTALLADGLRTSAREVEPLASAILEKTAGNPFFAVQFTRALCDDRALAFDPSLRVWRWDLDEVRARPHTSNVIDLVIRRVEQQPPLTRRVLSLLACLARATEPRPLAELSGIPLHDVERALGESVRNGFVLHRGAGYGFAHDRIAEAVYALLDEAERGALHTRIARWLLERRRERKASDDLFDIVNHLQRGSAGHTSSDERSELARLNVEAGERAKAASAFGTALSYFTAASALLPESTWQDDQAFMFELELARAECELFSARRSESEARLVALASRARDTIQLASVTRLRCAVLYARQNGSEAIELALRYLEGLGVGFPRRPTLGEVAAEHAALVQALGDRSVESLAELPTATDPTVRVVMDVMMDLLPAAFQVGSQLFTFATLRMANLSLRHGNTEASCIAYVNMLHIPEPSLVSRQLRMAFGELALALVQRRDLQRFKAGVFMACAYNVSPWKYPLRHATSLLRSACEAAQESGDPPFAAYSLCHIAKLRLGSGDPLPGVQKEAEAAQAFVQAAGFAFIAGFIATDLAFVRRLRGVEAALAGTELAASDARFEGDFGDAPALTNSAGWYWIRDLQASVYLGDIERAGHAARRASQLLWAMPLNFDTAEYAFFAALASAASLRATPVAVPDALVDGRELLARHASSCPQSFGSRAALLGAEIARLEARELDAQGLYDEAIRAAEQNSLPQVEGLACECAASFHQTSGRTTIADAYLQRARDAYGRWGASGKVRQLERLHPRLVPAPAGERAHAAMQQLDLGTVLKVSQALSREIILDRLIQALMTLALEHAGAERGLLVLVRDGKQQLAAEARMSAEGVIVELRGGDHDARELPVGVLNFVQRSHQSVLIDDASGPNEFWDDGYIRREGPRSLLCLPLLKLSELVGMLYLEHKLAPYAFTPARFAVLGLIASQSAMSLENARLYTELGQAKLYMSHAERLSQTGTFSWKPTSVELFWSDELYRILEVEPPPSIAVVRERIHPDDRAAFDALMSTPSRLARETFEHRLKFPDGRVKYVSVATRLVTDATTGEAQYVGALRDVTEMRRSQEALQNTQAALADLTKVATLGEMAAAIAHEVNQPLVAIGLNASACLRWLRNEPFNMVGAQNAASRIARDATRAGDVIRRLRALFGRSSAAPAPIDLNEAAREIAMLTRSQIQAHGASLRTELGHVPPTIGDRVQLQQVMVNLVVNAAEAMRDVHDRPREVTLRTHSEAGRGYVEVSDRGVGVPADQAERVFTPFYTTKPGGMGMGLSICRTIVESHGGRLSLEPSDGPGSRFVFWIPTGESAEAPTT